MKASLLAVLNEAERLLVAETEPSALRQLDEDEVVELHARVRSARNKYVGQYRRGASSRVVQQGARGKAQPKNQRAALKAEAFEEALARVSRRLAVLAAGAAAELRAQRIAAASAAKQGERAKATTATRPPSVGRGAKAAPTGDRALRSPATEKRRAGTRATGDRRQAKRDSR